MLLFTAQQTAQGPKVKPPPPVPPKLTRRLSHPTKVKPQLAPKIRKQSLSQSYTEKSRLLSQTAPKPHNATSLPKQPDTSEKPQGSSLYGLEYITLREMLADLVDLLAGNAPVITQLNNHLFSSGCIAKTVHIDAQNSFLSPTKRAITIIDALLATLGCNLNSNNVFISLITSLHKVGLTTIATKLLECFSK